ncbi:MAG: tetratricopeptide repeat protein [Luteibaculum sp.]
MRARRFFLSHHLLAFTLGLWLAFLVLRVFEFVSNARLEEINMAFAAFVSGFWLDFGVIVLLSVLCAVVSFVICLVSHRAMEISTGIYGALVIVAAALLSFYASHTGQMLSFYGDSGFGNSILGALKELGFMANLMLCIVLILVFALTYLRINVLSNGKFIVVLIVLFFMQGFTPNPRTWFELDSNHRVLATNKLFYFFEQRYADPRFYAESQKDSQQEKQEASLISGIEVSSGLEEDFKPVKKTVYLSDEEQAYLLKENLTSASSGSLFELAKVNAYRQSFFEAESIAKFLVIRQEDNADYRLIYGLILSWQKKFEDAEQQIREGLAISPQYDELYLALADIHYWNNEKTKAIHILDSGITHVVNPDRLYVKKEQLLASK